MLLALNKVDDLEHDNYPVHKPERGAVSAGGLEVSLDTYRVKANGTHIQLTSTELRLLHFMMSNAEQVHSRAQLLNLVAKRKTSPGKRTIDVHIRHLRVALEPFGLDWLIQTVHGRGYRFSCA